MRIMEKILIMGDAGFASSTVVGSGFPVSVNFWRGFGILLVLKILNVTKKATDRKTSSKP